MNRAAVLIGVRQTGGGLPRLQAVDDGIAAMEDWARGQGMFVSVLTDAGGPVTVPGILAAIRAVVEALNFDQLVIYFNGHGVNISDRVNTGCCPVSRTTRSGSSTWRPASSVRGWA